MFYSRGGTKTGEIAKTGLFTRLIPEHFSNYNLVCVSCSHRDVELKQLKAGKRVLHHDLYQNDSSPELKKLGGLKVWYEVFIDETKAPEFILIDYHGDLEVRHIFIDDCQLVQDVYQTIKDHFS
jgi:hypothetical protein